MQHDENGELVFTPDTDEKGNVVVEKEGGGTVKSDGGPTVRFDRTPGYLYTDKGTKIRAYKNLTDDKDLQTNCIGSTFAEGKYWIEPDSAGSNNVETILKDDNYKEVSSGNSRLKEVKPEDKLLFRNYNGKIHHAATIVSVDANNLMKINVESKNGGRPKETVNYMRSALPDSGSWQFFRKQ